MGWKSRTSVILIISYLSVICLGLALVAVHLVRSSEVFPHWNRVAMGQIRADSGFAYIAATGRPQLSSHEKPSQARVLEDGVLLSEDGNALHDDIRKLGNGRYSFWHDSVYFSASDNTDPRTNGRRYEISYPIVIESFPAGVLYGLTILTAALSSVLTVWEIHRRKITLSGCLVQIRQLPLVHWRTVLFGSTPKSILAAVMTCWLLAIVFCCTSALLYLNRLGVITPVWRNAALENIRPEIGFSYIAPTGQPLLSSHQQPSSAVVLENNSPLPGPANALHDDIRRIGFGRYSFWHGYIRFASSDNTDPRTNGRHYQIHYPLMVGNIAYLLYLLTFLALALAIFVHTAAVRERGISFDSLVTRPVFWVIVLTASISMVSIALAASWSVSLLVTNRVCLVAVLTNVLAAWVLRRKFGGSTPCRYFLPFFFAVLISFYLFAAKAPHRPQECTTEVAYSAWDGFCASPDSRSYYTDYVAGSTRQPIYPLFIKLVTVGSGFNANRWARQDTGRVVLTDPSDPLFRVERAQILFLLGAGLTACLVMVILLNSPLPCTLFVLLYYGRFLIPAELNQIMTETLVQAWLFLLVAAFMTFLWRKQRWLLPVAGALCGLLYLTRQAAGYTLIFFAAMIAWGLLSNWRLYWRQCIAGVVVFAGVASLTDIYGYFRLGHLAAAQENLQYQYRIAYALQFAQPQDIRLMPDEYSRHWLDDKLKVRDAAHEKVSEMCKGNSYCQQVYYINANLYEVATPPNFDKSNKAEFFMNVATPILRNHFGDYFMFGFRSWMLGLSSEEVSRIRIRDTSSWLVYAFSLVAILFLWGRVGFAAAVLIMGHLSHVALASLFAAPIPRMVQASEFLVVIAAFLLLWEAWERINFAVMQAVRPIELGVTS